MLEAVEGELCLLEVFEVVEVMSCAALYTGDAEGAEAMRCVLLCMLEAVDGGLCLLEVPEAMRRVLLCMPEVMRRVLLCVLEAIRCMLLCRCAGGCGGCAQLRGFEISIVEIFSLQSATF